MRHKLELQKGQHPKTLTVSDIRMKVEEIAEELSLKMHPGLDGSAPAATEAFPLDANKFIRHMSEFIRMN